MNYHNDFEYYVAELFSAAGFKTLHNIVKDDASHQIKTKQIYNDLIFGDGTTLGNEGRIHWDAKENSWITRRSYEHFVSQFSYYIMSVPGRDWKNINNIYVVPGYAIKFYFDKLPEDGWTSMPSSGDEGRQVKLLKGTQGEGNPFKGKKLFKSFLDSGCISF